MKRKRAAFTLVAFAAISVACVWKFWEPMVVWPSKQAPLLASLTDPASAQFRGQRLSQFGVLCGEVNSRNSMGGFVGFTKFLATSGSYAIRGYPTDPWYGGTKPTHVIVAELDREIDFMRARGRKRTEQEALHAEFDALWTQSCS